MALERKTIEVFTLNVWGLPALLVKEKTRRIEAIGKFLLAKNYDIVCLQELWCKNDYIHLESHLKKVLPFSQYYYSGVIGSGLGIFSKWPIVRTFYVSWNVNGYFHMVHHGDWFGGKGVAFAEVKINSYIVNVYNTHLIAKYNESDCYAAHRVIQALDTGLFIDLTSSGADLSIVCGDFNSTPGDICYNLIKKIGHLNDAYIPRDNNEKLEVGTNECPWNSFTNESLSKESGYRIDYILFKNGSKTHAEVLSYNMPLSSFIPGTSTSYSDHEAVEAKICLTDQGDLGYHYPKFSYYESALILEALNCCNLGEKQVNKNVTIFGVFTIFFLTLLILFNNLFPSWSLIVYLSITPAIMYCMFMATIWYKIELNSILAAKIKLHNLRKEFPD